MTVRLAIVLLCIPAWSAATDLIGHPQLRLELLQMEVEDQHYRQPGNQDADKAHEINRAHLKRLKQMIDTYGWPKISMVGEDGAQAAWLIIQHADHDRAFQGEVLSLIKPLLAVSEVSAETFAYLYDRVNLPQRYGTQGECLSAGQWRPYEIEDKANVDSRRAAIGMGPLADYVTLVSGYLCVEQQK